MCFREDPLQQLVFGLKSATGMYEAASVDIANNIALAETAAKPSGRLRSPAGCAARVGPLPVFGAYRRCNQCIWNKACILSMRNGCRTGPQRADDALCQARPSASLF